MKSRMDAKSLLRKSILEKRNSMSYDSAQEKSGNIASKLKDDVDYKNAKVVMFYMSKDKEVMTDEVIKEELRLGRKKIIVPKVHEKGLLCCEIKTADVMEFSCYGILEPKDEIICDLSSIDVIIVPGIVFDKEGYRIGFGRGYYDSLLKTARAKKIALAYDFQMIDKIPKDKWDVKMDKVIIG